MRVTVFGLWHLGCVTASCLAEAGNLVTGLDLDVDVVNSLRQGRVPLHEPGLDALIATEYATGRLRFSADPGDALAGAEILWVTLDTPVNEADEADVAWVRSQLEQLAPHLQPGTLVLLSSQLPVGFTESLERDWAGRGLHFACSPENLRLGKALDCFRRPERVVVGCRTGEARERIFQLLAPFSQQFLWMSVESAEMTKHALNAFLATSVAFINELSRLCELVGADAKEVENGLKSEPRIGPRAYLSPGAAFAGGTLARDVGILIDVGARTGASTALFQGVRDSNDAHKNWARHHLSDLLDGASHPVVAVLGLTYKPGTSTLRRSASIELCRWLLERNVRVKVHDPLVRTMPKDLTGSIVVAAAPEQALEGSDVAVLATEWPEYRSLTAEQFVQTMRRPRVIDQNHFLARTLAGDERVQYLATGRSVGKAA